MQISLNTSLGRLAPKKTETAASKSTFVTSELPIDGFGAGQIESGLIPRQLFAPISTPHPIRESSPLALQALSLGIDLATAASPGLSALGTTATETQKKEILGLFDNWNAALQTGDPDKVVEQYAEDAILLPTVSNKVRHTPDEIKDYFVHFQAKQPKGKIDESNIRMFGDLAINSGVYTFDFASGDSVQARFTFVYRKQDEEWKIVEHHSSAMPEKTSS